MQNLKFSDELHKFECAGPGLPLFFYYIKSCIILMAILFFIIDLYVISKIHSNNECLSLDEIKNEYTALSSYSDVDLQIALQSDTYAHICVKEAFT